MIPNINKLRNNQLENSGEQNRTVRTVKKANRTETRKSEPKKAVLAPRLCAGLPDGWQIINTAQAAHYTNVIYTGGKA